MRDIKELRADIDIIDRQMQQLFEQRMQVAREVALYKKTRNEPIYVPEREKALLADKVKRLQDPSLAVAAEGFFRTLMNLSKDEQRRLYPHALSAPRQTGEAIAYQGVPGAFSEQAAFECFGEQHSYQPCGTFEEVFKAVSAGSARYGVVPIENSTGGSIDEVYDLLGSYGCFIVAEHVVHAEQCLLAKPGVMLEDIREVYSHAQGLRQCSMYLSQQNWVQVPYYNTAISAKMVAESERNDIAAIASRRAAACYGLNLLAPDIMDRCDNDTRFVVVAAQLEEQHGQGKVSLTFTVNHQAGALHMVLALFAAQALNLTKIESRNIPGKHWEYRFYVDFEGNVEKEAVDRIFSILQPYTNDIKLLGYYKTSLGENK